jgi:dGTPase
MFERVYLGDAARREQERVTKVIHALFDHYLERPELVGEPTGEVGEADADLATRVTDYLAGMTDRFCIRQFEELTVPREFRY